MKYLQIASQIFGIAAMIFLFSIYQQKKRKRLILGKLGADICWTVHYLCLGAFSGMVPNLVGIVRETIFIQKENRAWARAKIWPLIFILINWSLSIPTLKSPICFLPIAASTFVTLSLWLNNIYITKLISIPVSMSFFIYDYFVGSYVGMVNESLAILSIIIFFIIEGRKKKMKNIFSEDIKTEKELQYAPKIKIDDYSKIITTELNEKQSEAGKGFSEEITRRFVADFEKDGDKMVHVSTFAYIGDYIYMTYYANTSSEAEDPEYQKARLVFCPINDVENKTFIDIQAVGDLCCGKKITMVYDTILMPKDDDTLFILWTARVEEKYYRLCRTYTISTGKLSEVTVNRFKVGNTVNDFSTTGIRSALAENGLKCKTMYSDIGIMQKLSSRIENGERYYYSGTYSGDFTCIIKSRDFITWEYVSQPDFVNESMWENATYVIGDRCFYFVRQQENCPYGFLTCYNIDKDTWDKPVLVEDCQSRGDFIEYNGSLFLFHAPTDREHIGIIKIDTEDISKSEVVLQAKMDTSCFYPFIQYDNAGELCMSYTVNRKHIRLAHFTLSKYL